MSAKLKLSLLLVALALVSMAGLLAWRIQHAPETTVRGELRLGSLSCPGPCQIELALTDGTRITSRECALPDALRDRTGVQVVAAGTWTESRVLEASHLFVIARPQANAVVPSGCETR